MFALCTAVTLRRPFSLARRKAYSAILRELLLVIILRLSTTPETLWRKEKCKTNERQTLLTCSYKLFYVLLPDLMFQTAVLSLCVLPDDHDVNVFMASLDSREGLAVHHISKQV